MNYDFDSYLLYEVSQTVTYAVRIRVILRSQVDGDVLKKAAEKAFRRFPYFARTVSVDEKGGYVLEPCDRPITVTSDETAAPDLAALPDEEPLGEYNGGDSFMPISDYMELASGAPNIGQVYYPITIEKKQLLRFARENDGSPNSQADIFDPYEKHHSTVKDACELAERLGADRTDEWWHSSLYLHHSKKK